MPRSSVRRLPSSADAPGGRASASPRSPRGRSISSSTRSRKDATTASLYSGPSSSWAAAAARMSAVSTGYPRGRRPPPAVLRHLSAMTRRRAVAYGSPVRAIRSRAAALILSCDIASPDRWLRPALATVSGRDEDRKESTRGLCRTCPQALRPAPGPSQLGSGRRGCLQSGYNAGTGAGRDHRLQDVQHRRVRDAAPVRGEQAPRLRVTPVGTVLAGHRDGAPGLGRVQRPPAPVHVVFG